MDNLIKVQGAMEEGQNKEKVWHEVLESIKVSVSGAIYSTWFLQTHLADLTKTNNRFVAEIGCNSAFIKGTIESRYFGLVQDNLQKSLGETCDINFVVKTPTAPAEEAGSASPLFQTQEARLAAPVNGPAPQSKIRSSFSFENFAVSSSNQMAWAAAEAVAKNPGSAYNPLFIWGGVGVGKTHLMNAVGLEILKQGAENKVYLCTGEEFTNDIVEGIRNKSTQSFRTKYRKLNALLIDDIQFIAGKDAVQEEFFHTFNALAGSGSQIILTSDRPPSEISKLEERLRSRFEAGLIVDVAPPDFELRCAITQIKCAQKGLPLQMDQVQLIAGNIESARKIEGFLTRLTSESALRKTPITLEFIESLLGKTSEAVNGTAKRVTPEEIIVAVAKHFSLGKRALLGQSRARPIAVPRQILMYLLRLQLNLPLEEVGRLVGDRDHTTVMHAVQKITHLASSDVQIREDIQGIKHGL